MLLWLLSFGFFYGIAQNPFVSDVAFAFISVHCKQTLWDSKPNKPTSVQMWCTMQMWKLIALCRIFFIRSHDPLYWMSVRRDSQFVVEKWTTDSGQGDWLVGCLAYVWRQLDKEETIQYHLSQTSYVLPYLLPVSLWSENVTWTPIIL